MRVVKVEVLTSAAYLDDDDDGAQAVRARADAAIRHACRERGLTLIDESLCLESSQPFGVWRREEKAFRAGKLAPHAVPGDHPDAMIIGLTLTFSAMTRAGGSGDLSDRPEATPGPTTT